jgi:hypothetical protein
MRTYLEGIRCDSDHSGNHRISMVTNRYGACQGCGRAWPVAMILGAQGGEEIWGIDRLTAIGEARQ